MLVCLKFKKLKFKICEIHDNNLQKFIFLKFLKFAKFEFQAEEIQLQNLQKIEIYNLSNL